MPVNITNRIKAQKLLLVEEMLVLSKVLDDTQFLKCLKGLIKLRTRKMSSANTKKYYDYVQGILSTINRECLVSKLQYKKNDIPPDSEDISILDEYSKTAKTTLISKAMFVKKIQDKFRDAIVIISCGNTMSVDSPVTYYCCKCRRQYTVSRRSLENRRRACFCNSELNGDGNCGLVEDRVSADLVAL